MKNFTVAFIVIFLLLFAGLLSAEKIDYFPLKAGNKWLYKVEVWDEDKKFEKTQAIELSSQDYDEITRTTRYYDEKGEVLFIKAADGILNSFGRYWLKYPIQEGAKWVSSGARNDYWHFKIEKIHESVEVMGKVYHDCIVVSFRTNQITAQIKGEIVSYFIENISYMAPNVGRVLSETYRIPAKGKERTLETRMTLLTFQKSATPDKDIVLSKELLKEVKGLESAFRYPEKGVLRPTLSPDNQWVAYLKKKGSDFEVWLAHIDGTENQKLDVPAYRGPQKMTWSSDGQKLAVEVEIDYAPYIFIVQFNSRMPEKTYQLSGESPRWFFDSERLIYVKKEKKSNSVVISRFDGENIKEVFRFSDYLNDLSLSPNGDLLAFSSMQKGMKIFELAAINPSHIASAIDSITGKNFSRIQWTSKGDKFLFFDRIDVWVWDSLSNEKMMIHKGVIEAKWSPDGKRIAFVTSSFPKKFFIHNLDDSSTVSFDSNYGGNYTWSPDSKLIAFRDKKKGVSMFTSGVFLMDSETGEVKRRVSSVSGSHIDFSRDGKWLLWESFMAETFFIVELN